jgi:hypothetical protein
MEDIFMMKIWNCRRSTIALIAIGCLTWLGLDKGIDISGIALAISGIVASISGSNAWEKRGTAPAPVKAEDDVS